MQTPTISPEQAAAQLPEMRARLEDMIRNLSSDELADVQQAGPLAGDYGRDAVLAEKIRVAHELWIEIRSFEFAALGAESGSGAGN